MQGRLTESLFRDVIGSFDWPVEYSVDNDLPDGMIIRFSQCALYFAEGYEGDMRLHFLPENTGVDLQLELGHAMMVVAPLEGRDGTPLTAGLFRDETPRASEEKVRHGIHDLCLVVLTHLKHVVRGDFSWVAKYRAMMSRQAPGSLTAPAPE